MTYCNTLAEPLIKKVEIEKKSLDEIAKELCGDTVKRPRQNVIRIIKELLGVDYLVKHAETLGYDVKKAVRIKSATSDPVNGKICSKPDAIESVENSAKIDVSSKDNETQNTVKHFDLLVRLVRKLVDRFSLTDVKRAVAMIEQP
jgi:hypothetical protein